MKAATTNHFDPLDDLRTGWTTHIDFAVANPALFALLSDPGRVLWAPAADAGRRLLEARVHLLAATGRFRVSERRAIDLIAAAGVGAVLTIRSSPTDQRDSAVHANVPQAILTDSAPPTPANSGPLATAVAFRATVGRLDTLSAAGHRLLGEWLDRTIETLQADR